MEGLAIIVMLLALLALIGVLVYIVRDYYVHKETNAADFGKTTSDIAAERTDRLGNLKYVVDQVNTVNDDIYACLLYTSPSPRDLSTSRMPSSA